MKVIIAGDRDFVDFKLLKQKCDKILEGRVVTCILSGKSRGADTLGEAYAKYYGILVEPYPANFEKHGKGAGPKRNLQMVGEADMLIAFDGGGSGTKDVIRKAWKRDLETHTIDVR